MIFMAKVVDSAHMRTRRGICFLLVMAMCLLGIYSKNRQADFFLAYASAQQTPCSILSRAFVMKDTEPCTAEMLGIRSDTQTRQTAGRPTGQKRDIRISLDSLCPELFSLKKKSFLASSEIIQFCRSCQKELLTDYIHELDGKKRI